MFAIMRIKYTKEQIQDAVNNSLSWSAVCRILGIKAATGSQSHIKNRAINFDIDYSHFTGRAHARGKIGKYKQSLDKYFTNEVRISSHNLKNRLIKEKIKECKCEDCGLSEWQNKNIPLELHHIDKNHFNNDLLNLKIVCPNCHSLY